MFREADLIGMIEGLRRTELRRWVALGWVVPERGDGTVQFREIDVARVRLIVDMRREMRISEENLPMVLSLVDQVYSLRRELRDLADAVGTQPEDVRQAIARHLRHRHGTEPRLTNSTGIRVQRGGEKGCAQGRIPE